MVCPSTKTTMTDPTTLLAIAFGASAGNEERSVEEAQTWRVKTIALPQILRYNYMEADMGRLLPFATVLAKTYPPDVRTFNLVFELDTRRPAAFAVGVSLVRTLATALMNTARRGPAPHTFFSKVRLLEVFITLPSQDTVAHRTAPPALQAALYRFFTAYVHYGRILQTGQWPTASRLSLQYLVYRADYAPTDNTPLSFGKHFHMPAPGRSWTPWNSNIDAEEWLGSVRPRHLEGRMSTARRQELPDVAALSLFR